MVEDRLELYFKVYTILAHLSYSSYVWWASAHATRVQRFLSVQALINSSICKFDEVLYTCVIQQSSSGRLSRNYEFVHTLGLQIELPLCMHIFKLCILLQCLSILKIPIPSLIAPLTLCSYFTYQVKFSFLCCHSCIQNQSHTASSGCEAMIHFPIYLQAVHMNIILW